MLIWVLVNDEAYLLNTVGNSLQPALLFVQYREGRNRPIGKVEDLSLAASSKSQLTVMNHDNCWP